jgi:hypothetical protein
MNDGRAGPRYQMRNHFVNQQMASSRDRHIRARINHDFSARRGHLAVEESRVGIPKDNIGRAIPHGQPLDTLVLLRVGPLLGLREIHDSECNAEVNARIGRSLKLGEINRRRAHTPEQTKSRFRDRVHSRTVRVATRSHRHKSEVAGPNGTAARRVPKPG